MEIFLFLVLLLITWAAMGLLARRFIMENKELRDRTRELLWKLGELKPANSKNTIYEKRIKALEDEIQNFKRKKNGLQQPDTNPGTPETNQSVTNSNVPIDNSTRISKDQEIITPSTSSEKETKTPLWVKRTQEGLFRLEKADKPTEMFLIPQGNRFLLNIKNLEPSNYSNIVVLFDDVLEFPVGPEFIGSLKMEKHPEYEEQNGQFVFIAKGKIKVNQ